MRHLLLTALTLMITMTAAAQWHFDESHYTPTATTFRVFAPADAKAVTLRLYRQGTGGKAWRRVKMTAEPAATDDESRNEAVAGTLAGAIFRAEVKGDLKGIFYTFDTGHGETPGVAARAVGLNGRRAAVVDLNDTDPEGWADDVRPVVKSPADLVVYELHHRDFSIARPDARYPGKFLALTEPWAIDHLRHLGVNAVHLLPSYDFGSVDEAFPDRPQYNWGYDPVNYNVPEGSYSNDAADPLCRIREFKQMVQALHRAGIRVILDVVYNHTYDIDHSNFQRTFPDYYYRVGSNGSGCGNETASERPMMRRFMIESVRHWMREYHIDGFRFDLMGCHDITTMQQIRQAVDEIDPTIFIYGEGWSAGPCALPTERLAVKANTQQLHGIAAFSDELRDALRGPFDDDSRGGWLAQTGDDVVNTESLKAGIAGMTDHPQVDYAYVNYSRTPWADSPTQMMAYVSCHDDMCLTDRLRASIPGIDDVTLRSLDALAATAVFTSQGVPFMLSGEELMRTKKGVHNSFESPDSINQLDWSATKRYPEMLEFYARLIALRSHHPAFRLGSADLVRRHLEFLPTKPGVVAFRLNGYAGRDDWRTIIVVLNASRSVATIDVPRRDYTVVLAGLRIDEAGLGTAGNKGPLRVAPQSALIVHD